MLLTKAEFRQMCNKKLKFNDISSVATVYNIKMIKGLQTYFQAMLATTDKYQNKQNKGIKTSI